MSGERTTINVSKEAHQEAKKAKDENETWSDYLLRSTDQEAVEKRDCDLDEITHKLDQIQSAQGNTVSDALEAAEGCGVDYAEIETRMGRVIERMLR